MQVDKFKVPASMLSPIVDPGRQHSPWDREAEVKPTGQLITRVDSFRSFLQSDKELLLTGERLDNGVSQSR